MNGYQYEDPLEGLDISIFDRDIRVAINVPIERLLTILDVFDAVTMTRFLTNEGPGLVDSIVNPERRSSGSRVITDGNVESGKIVNAKYAADITRITEGVRTRDNVENASHQIMVWVSSELMSHKKIKSLIQNGMVNTAGKISLEPNVGRHSRV